MPAGGKLTFLEGSQDGLDAINRLRARFALKPLQEPWYDKHFDSREFFEFVEPLFEVEATRSLDPYFLMSRVLYPLAVAPEEPRFDHPCNTMARMAVPFMKTDEGTTLLICAKLRKRG